MGLFVTICFLLITIFSILKNKDIISPNAIFGAEWTAISFLASRQLYGFYEISDTTWIIVFVGGISFFVGTWISSRFGTRHKALYANRTSDLNSPNGTDPKNKRLFWLCMGVLFVVKMILLYRSLRFLSLGYTLADIRGASYGAVEISGYEYTASGVIVLVRKVFNAFSTFVIAVGIYLSIFSKKKDNKPLIACVIMTLLSALTDGGRYGIAYLLIEIFICFVIEKKQLQKVIDAYHRKKRGKLFYIFVGAFLLIMIIRVTAMRGRTGSAAIEMLYQYMCGNIFLLDKHIRFLSKQELTYGYLGLYGLATIVLPSLKKIGIPYPEKYLRIGSIAEQPTIPQRIGEHSFMNAFVTPYFYLYADFRWLGIIFGMLIFGCVCGASYKRAIKGKREIDVVMYLLVGQMIFKTIQQYYLSSSDYVIILIFVFLVRRVKFRITPRNGNSAANGTFINS